MAEYFQLTFSRTVPVKGKKRGIVTKINKFRKIDSDDPIGVIIEESADLLDSGFCLTWNSMSRAEFLRKVEDSFHE